jgi:hypothetical protein
LWALRASLATLPQWNAAAFDKLEAYAQAAAHAHSAHLRNDSQFEVTRLGEQAQRARERLLFDATALARRGLLDAKVLEALKGPSGYRNVLFDLAALSNLLRDAWPRIEGKTAVDFSELAAARTLSADLNTALGLREQEQGEQTESAMDRKRAFTLFVQAYDEVRRATVTHQQPLESAAMNNNRKWYGGMARPLGGNTPGTLHLPAHHLVTHGVIVGMTGRYTQGTHVRVITPGLLHRGASSTTSRMPPLTRGG